MAGPLAPTSSTAAIHTLATHLGAPLLADINSGLRCDGQHAPVLALYNLYLRGAVSRLPPVDLVLYFGDRIVSEPLREYLAAHRTEFILCSPYPLRQDAIENEFIYPTMKVWSDPCAFAAELLPALPARRAKRIYKPARHRLGAVHGRQYQFLPVAERALADFAHEGLDLDARGDERNAAHPRRLRRTAPSRRRILCA